MVIVKLEFKRIQTFLFSSTRLKDMVGSNALLGNVIRLELCQTALKYACDVTQQVDIAIRDDVLATISQGQDGQLAEFYGDDPASLWKKGILSRDGGHLVVAVADTQQAGLLVEALVAQTERLLPGIRTDVTLGTLEHGVFEAIDLDHGNVPRPPDFPILPVFQPCEVSQNALAEKKQQYGSTGALETRYISGASYRKRIFMQQAQQDNNESGASFSADIASQLMSYFHTQCGTQPGDLSQLVEDHQKRRGYLSVIAVDGNNMGGRLKQWLAKSRQQGEGAASSQDWLKEQEQVEQFFYSARVAMRNATFQALNSLVEVLLEQFHEPPEYLPFEILMLGGDDLLVLCEATYSFRLVHDLQKALQNSDNCLADGDPLGVCAGLVVAKQTLPFHQLHSVAEHLLTSAKIASRNLPDSQSVIDWHVATQSWVDDPINERKTQLMRHLRFDDGSRQSLVLTQKPYLLGDIETDTLPAFNLLLQEAGKLHQLMTAQRENESEENGEKVARSQLRRMVTSLQQGYQTARLAWHDLPLAIDNAISGTISGPPDTRPWIKTRFEEQEYCLTFIRDLVELLEVNHLIREQKPAAEASAND